MSRRSRHSQSGFTLMEILLVMSILVILGGTAMLFFARVQKNAMIDAAKTQISQYKTAIEVYRMEVGSLPADQDGLEALRTAPASLTNPAKWRGPYIQTELALDPWDMPYVYQQVSVDTFQIASYGPDKTQGTDDDVVH
jgi:general secretion pathway protein G